MESLTYERSGIRIVNYPKVHPAIKNNFIAYAKWLRENYDFPQRVVVYVKDTEHIMTKNKEQVSATFFAPFNKLDEPYIKIAAGDFDKLKKEMGVFQAVFNTLNSLSHELQHYYQWIDNEELDETEALEGAEELTYEYLDFYKEEFLSNRFRCS